MIKRNPYNTITFVIFALLITGSFTYFSFAENDTNLTLFEDFDRDGLSNSEEKTLGTDPKKDDSDGDGYTDGVEVESGYNPLIPAPGDRIVQERKPAKFTPANSQTTNVTKKISENVVSYLADAQESGEIEITSEEFSAVVSEAVDKEISFTNTPPVDISEISIKNQDYDDMSEREKEEKMREDAIEYFTAVAYIFTSSFPQGFFERPVETFQTELMDEFNTFSETLTEFSYFTQMAENSIAAENQMSNIVVPEEMLDIHVESLYLLRYAGDMYESGDYKDINTDATPMIAILAQVQGLIEMSDSFQNKVGEKLQKYDIEEIFEI